MSPIGASLFVLQDLDDYKVEIAFESQACLFEADKNNIPIV